MKNFLHRLSHWEYWPFEVVYFPIFFYWFYLSLKARSFFFFSAANPTIESGGMLGESKSEIYNLIPDEYIPKTHKITFGNDLNFVLALMKATSMEFPIVCKPDIGERGTQVEVVKSVDDLKIYIDFIRQDFLIQEFVAFEKEYALFYIRMPNALVGTITSLTGKKFLSITGDGERTLEELMELEYRSAVQAKRLQKKFAERWNSIIPKNEKIILEPIGNHCRGTEFMNCNHQITEDLTRRFDRIASQIPGFYFGRFDLRCSSIEKLSEGLEFKILELNGAGAEPAHIYDSTYTLWNGWKTLLKHWNYLYKIARINHDQFRVPYISISEAYTIYTKIKEIKSRYN